MFAEYSVIVTDIKNESGCLKNRFEEPDQVETSTQTKSKMRKTFHFIEGAYFVIIACCRLEKD